MNIHLEDRADGGLAFYLDGDLQFDSDDEAIYHESLALPPLCMAQSALGGVMRVLICGGGDGLALREVLRFPGVTHVDLVDCSPEVIALGRTTFVRLNQDAFADGRAHVHVADARAFVENAPDGTYDAAICDFTVPRTQNEAGVFTREWFASLARVVRPNGFIALNAVSPQVSPNAFWCLHKTVRAAGLSVLPLRVCIPSFRRQGFGAWGFLLASRSPTLQSEDLKRLAACPVPTRAVDLAMLPAAAAFSAAERAMEAHAPIHTDRNGALIPLLLNPQTGTISPDVRAAAPPSIEGVLQAIPILHPYYTRAMVESLAEQVIGTVRMLDLRRLLDALLARAAELSGDLRRNLQNLRAYLDTPSALSFETLGDWARRLFVALALLLTIANVVAPDNAFGKGAEGLGHASVSAGYGEGGSFGRSGAFGEGSFGRGPSGYAASPARAGGSFGGFRTTSEIPDAPLTGSGFRSSYHADAPVDIFGNSYRPRIFEYRNYSGENEHVFSGGSGGGSGGSSGGGGVSPSPPQAQPARFVADDDMLVLDNGDVAVTLSDAAYLLVSGGNVTLMNVRNPEPLLGLYPDPRLFANIQARLRDQKTAAQREIGLRKDWLGWVSWTAPLFPIVRADEDELKNIEDLVRRLDAAANRVGLSGRNAPPPDLSPALALNAIELFIDGGLLVDGRVALIDRAGVYRFTDGKSITTGDANTPEPASLALNAALRSILVKLQKESEADAASLGQDQLALERDRKSLQSDDDSYHSLQAQYGSDYSVDYGTDEIPARDAITRTEADLRQNAADTAACAAQRRAKQTQASAIADAVPRFSP